MPIGTCMKLLVKPVTVTDTHCSAERHHYAEDPTCTPRVHTQRTSVNGC